MADIVPLRNEAPVFLIEAIELLLKVHTHQELEARTGKRWPVPNERPTGAPPYYDRCWRMLYVVLREYHESRGRLTVQDLDNIEENLTVASEMLLKAEIATDLIRLARAGLKQNVKE
jgi:hypothetical protein